MIDLIEWSHNRHSDDWVGKSDDVYKKLNSYLKEHGGDGIRIIISN